MSENEYNPDYVSAPGETLEETLEYIGMSQAELARRMGRPLKTINEIIQGKAAITADTALQLERVLGVSANYWNNHERSYRASLARHQAVEQLRGDVGWLCNFPLAEMIRRGWLEHSADEVEQVRLLLQFFGVASVELWQLYYEEPANAWLKRTAAAATIGAIAAWIRQGEIIAQQMFCTRYNAATFKNTLNTIRPLTKKPFAEMEAELGAACAAAGVAVVFVDELGERNVTCATHWLNFNKAIIQFNPAHKDDEQAWFTFFHAAAHILLHDKQKWFLEGLAARSNNKRGYNADLEAAADHFATIALTSPSRRVSSRPATNPQAAIK